MLNVVQIPFGKDELTTDKAGNVKPNLINAIAILRAMNKAHGMKLYKYNEFTGSLLWKDEKITDSKIIALRVQINEIYGVLFSDGTMNDAFDYVARENGFHPVRDYLKGLQEWKPKDFNPDEILKDFLIKYVGAKSTIRVLDEPTKEEKEELQLLGKPGKRRKHRYKTLRERWYFDYSDLLEKMGHCFLISCVARVMEPGCKVDTCLVLGGVEGIGKSLFFKTLAVKDEWFCDSPIAIGDGRDSFAKIEGIWLYELAEMASTRKKDNEAIKAFLTSATDRYSKKYARHTIDQKRQTVFAGTTNELGGYLRGQTGNRRFHPVEAIKIDIKQLKKDRDLIWLAALELYERGEKHYLDGEYAQLLKEIQAPVTIQDSWEDAILNWQSSIHHPTDLRTILEDALGIETSKQNKAHLNRLTNVLNALGWQRIRVRKGNKRPYKWARP